MTRQAIQAHATAIKIPFLAHFTRVANLPSIMRHGLYPISRAAQNGIKPEANDELRLDGHKDASSLSIGFPNYKMFYKYRLENPGVEWAVLGIEPSVLWTKDCAFCCHNAADARVSCLPPAQLKTPEAFIRMYEEIEGVQSREEQRLKPFDPTDGQAEVLVFDIIEPEFIGGAIFENSAIRDAYLEILGDRQVLVSAKNKGVFASRGYVR